ncbi:MAG: DUF2007 domain-containing protein [Chitinophagales bacterium]
MISIATFFDHFKTDLAKSKLEAYGISCILKDDSVLQSDLFGNGITSKVELLIQEADKENALKLLEEEETN